MAKYTTSILELLQEQDMLLKRSEETDDKIVNRLHHFDDIFPVSKSEEMSNNDEELKTLRAAKKDISDRLKINRKKLKYYILNLFQD